MGITGLDILGDFGLANGSGGGSRLAPGILASHTEQWESEHELTLDDRNYSFRNIKTLLMFYSLNLVTITYLFS